MLIEQRIGRPGALVWTRGIAGPLFATGAARGDLDGPPSESLPSTPTVRLVARFQGPTPNLLPLTTEETEPLERSHGPPPGRIQTHWLPGPGATLLAHVRAEIRGSVDAVEPVVRSVRARLRWASGLAVRLEPMATGRRTARSFERGELRPAPLGSPWSTDPVRAGRMVAALEPMREEPDLRSAHTFALGASGAGKTTFLVESAVRALALGRRVVAVDVHGDLAPAIVGRIPPELLSRVVALDPTVDGVGSVGVGLLPRRDDPAGDRAAAHLVASLRRVSADGSGEVYWGFRLERLFDAFVRIARDEAGDLADLWELLTDARRRDAARLTVTDPDSVRFLDDLGTLLKRVPDLLWPATARIAKLVTQPALRRLFASPGPTIDLNAELPAGRPLLVRLPLGEVGPEAAAFAATLLVGRFYFARTFRPALRADAQTRTLLVLDEAHAVAPALLVEILAEGRKFGVELVAATQYVERLHPDVRAAAEGAVGRHVVFRTPPPGARAAGSWVGVDAATASSLLPSLPFGEALVACADDPLRVRRARLTTGTAPRPGDWAAAVARTAAEHGAEPSSSPTDEGCPGLVEELLFDLVAADERRDLLDVRQLVQRVVARTGREPDAALAAVAAARRRRWLIEDGGRVVLTEAGARYLGWGAPTGATRESAEHRALLFEAFRLFARHGARLEVLRQGSFEHRLPDARLLLLTESTRRLPGDLLAREVARRRDEWVWRAFRGRDVHLEAEVSGSLRPERVRRGVAKARAAGAFALFVTADARLANRVRRVLHADGLVPERAQVWTLRRAAVVRPPSPGRNRETPGGMVLGSVGAPSP